MLTDFGQLTLVHFFPCHHLVIKRYGQKTCHKTKNGMGSSAIKVGSTLSCKTPSRGKTVFFCSQVR